MKPIAGLGTAHGAVSHWWHQRLTAIALIPLGLWLAIALPRIDLGSQAALVAWIREPMTAIMLSLTASCLVYHSWLGVRVVLEDYVPVEGTRLVSLLLSFFAHAFLFAVCLFAILRISFMAA